MDDFRAAMIAEGEIPPADDGEFLEAWQHLVDTGLAWKLQGRIGRTAAAMIEAGEILPAPTAQCDYWGNPLPWKPRPRGPRLPWKAKGGAE